MTFRLNVWLTSDKILKSKDSLDFNIFYAACFGTLLKNLKFDFFQRFLEEEALYLLEINKNFVDKEV